MLSHSIAEALANFRFPCSSAATKSTALDSLYDFSFAVKKAFQAAFQAVARLVGTGHKEVDGLIGYMLAYSEFFELVINADAGNINAGFQIIIAIGTQQNQFFNALIFQAFKQSIRSRLFSLCHAKLGDGLATAIIGHSDALFSKSFYKILSGFREERWEVAAWKEHRFALTLFVVAEKIVFLFSYEHAIALFGNFIAICINCLPAHDKGNFPAINFLGAVCCAIAAEKAMVRQVQTLGKASQVYFMLRQKLTVSCTQAAMNTSLSNFLCFCYNITTPCLFLRTGKHCLFACAQKLLFDKPAQKQHQHKQYPGHSKVKPAVCPGSKAGKANSVQSNTGH